MKQLETVEHYIEGPRKPVLQEKQVFLVLHAATYTTMTKSIAPY